MDAATALGESERGAVPWAAGLESPFAEAPLSFPQDHYAMPDMLSAALTPFADSEDLDGSAEAEELLRETFAELHDEDFHEAVSLLAEETEAAIEDRFQDEEESSHADREGFARSHLGPVQFEADQYLASLEAGLAESDPATLAEAELEEWLERFDPDLGALSPASEEFIGGLVKKAKSVVRKVATVAKTVGKLASPLLMPMLGKLRGLVRPLLERVLKFAIGKLPAPLQPKARILADRILGKAGVPAQAQAPGVMGQMNPPIVATNTEELADSFDLSLAEAVAFPGMLSAQEEAFGAGAGETIDASDELEALAEARSALIAELAASESEDALAPQIEQFVPVLLAALRTGIGLVGRPKVVSFLAGYLAKMIQQYVGPQDSRPLSQAIVDAGLKMVSLEAESRGDASAEAAGPVALASVIEDTVRRLTEAEEYLFEDRDLTEVAVADAFAEAAATYLPQDMIREDLQLAPSIGGLFVTRRPGRARSFAKYSRVPEVAISARAADSLPAYRGGSLGAAVRAAGGRFPLRARMHIFQARPGSSVAGMMRHGLRNAPRTMGAFPLTPRAAGVLLREPGLGGAGTTHKPRSSRSVGAGQRLYVLEPLDQNVAAAGRPPAPGRSWIAVNAARKRITIGFYLSEADAQLLAGALRSGRGHGEILRKLLGEIRSLGQGDTGPAGLAREDGEDFEDFAARVAAKLPQAQVAALRRRIAAWALPALSAWLRDHKDDFLQAANQPDPGVRLRVRLSDVPGLDQSGAGGAAGLAAIEQALKGKPKIAISVAAGSRKR